TRVLGNADEFFGFYGAARKLLSMFGGTIEAFGRTQIKGYNGSELAPQSGSGEVVIGARVPPNRQEVVLSQFNYLKWSAESLKPMAELNRLSKAGEITWYDGFTITDLGLQPFDAAGLDEEE
ncbi:MAG: hypothetical protein VXX40_00665, partial [Candidatus Thermoplasmatota archaeon]|nr:hypothetical protein [Candidatus Thermoplasmatota archaeon]